MTAEELKLEIEKWIEEQREDLGRNFNSSNFDSIYYAKSSLLNLLHHHLTLLEIKENPFPKEKEPEIEMISKDAIRGWLWATCSFYGPFKEDEEGSTNGAYEVLNSLSEFVEGFKGEDY